MGRPIQFQKHTGDKESVDKSSEITIEEDQVEKVIDEAWEKGIQEIKEGEPFDPDYITFHSNKTANSIRVKTSKILEEDDDEDIISPNIIVNSPCMTSLPTMKTVNGIPVTPIRTDATIVIIRHGKTDYNKLGLFTGWEDVPLTNDGKFKSLNYIIFYHHFLVHTRKVINIYLQFIQRCGRSKKSWAVIEDAWV